ncbi:MAG: isoprenyl transferase [Candidatus Melainabacteria bacterium]|nr:MAG: isoprenyl transferase [Candidatus Melainabacteria bacterium]
MKELAPKIQTMDKAPLPVKHVAVIMDGNRRWATQRKLPKLIGHQEGVKSLKRLVKHVGAVGLEYLTVYAFSSENWQRADEEVSYLLKLFVQVLSDEVAELHKNKVRLRFIGKLGSMPEDLRIKMQRAEDTTAANTGLNLQVAINYGSRLEITEALKKIAQDAISGKISVNEITEELVSSYLYTNEIPDPELLIRTGGEMRLSNYLLWQSAYTEIYICDAFWPDFSPEQFDLAIEEFKTRHRRYGS